MSSDMVSETTTELRIENIGGISQSETTFEPGVTVLTGKNATNRTSFLQGIMAACGSEHATLKADADEGQVELTLERETYLRTLTRQNGTVHFGGTPYLEDPTIADLFAFLFKNNEARQAVTQGDDLREIIMRPVDTDEIDQEIRDLEAERDEIDEELQRLDSQEERLPELETEKAQLEEEIEVKESELSEKRRKLEELNVTAEESRKKKQEREAKIDELSQKRRELNKIERRIQNERESLENLEAEREDLKEKLAELDEVEDERISQMEDEINHLRGQIQQIDTTVNDLQPVIQFNEEFLEEGRPAVLENLDDADRSNDHAVTDKLLSDTEDIVCWTCGSEVETDQIESMLDRLRSVRNDKMDEKQSLQSRIEDLQKDKSRLEKQQQDYERTQQKLAEVETEIDNRNMKLNDLMNQKESVEEIVAELREDVEKLEEDDQSEILEVQKEVSRLEVKLDQLEADFNDVENEIAEIESLLADRESLEQQCEEINTQLADLRMRVENLQEEAIEEFNTHMDAILELLDYDNLERIWIDRTKSEVMEGRRKVMKDRFDLHVVRSTDSGTVYEDTVHHLSESEREVTGLMFALAGYLVHDVYETVPFMLLDSIEAIDSDRISQLVDYLAGYADYLVVALLEEDAAALDEDYPRIESI